MWFHLVRISAPLSASLCGFCECWCKNYKLIHRNSFSEGCHGTVVAIVNGKIGWRLSYHCHSARFPAPRGSAFQPHVNYSLLQVWRCHIAGGLCLSEGKSKLFSCPKPPHFSWCSCTGSHFDLSDTVSSGSPHSRLLSASFETSVLVVPPRMLPVSLQVLPSGQGPPLQRYLSHVLCLFRGNLIYDELLGVISVFSLRRWWLVSVSSCGLSNASQRRKGP